MKLTAFQGTTTIMKQNRNISFADGKLTVDSLTSDEALALIGVLEMTYVQYQGGDGKPVMAHHGHAPPNAQPTPPAEPAAAPAEPPPVKPQVDQAAIAKLAATAPAAAPKEPKEPKAPRGRAAAKEAPAPEPEAAPAEAAPTRAQPAEPPSAKANGHTNGHANGNGKGADGDSWGLSSPDAPPIELMQARKLRDVLVYLLKQGITDPNKVLAECERLKSQVPVLQRITNMEERVPRTLGVIDLEGDEG